jgi:serine/threonine protein phosphatase 1
MTRSAIPNGQRVYAIGDIHGRLDLLEIMIAAVRDDNERRGPAITSIIVLGDIIDRGPHSAQIVRRFQAYTQASHRFIVLRGNHEATMVQALCGDMHALKAWLRFGGDETLKSWGVKPEDIRHASLPALAAAANRRITRADMAWLSTRPLSHQVGDYLFVHAGVRPGTPLAEQDPQDLLWITREFTESAAPHGAVIVHGHTIEEDGPVLRDNRIGLDTGAYRSGRLTALGLEGADRWILTAQLAGDVRSADLTAAQA